MRAKTKSERFLSGAQNRTSLGPEGDFVWDPAQQDAIRDEEIPEHPAWLVNPYGVAEWYKLLPLMMQHNVISQAGLDTLAIFCGLFGRIVEALAQNLTPNVQALSLYRQLANDFGLTPVSQGKVKPLGEKKKDNPFDKNGDDSIPPPSKSKTSLRGTPSFGS